MRYLYGVSDEKYIKSSPREEKRNSLLRYKFRLHPVVEGRSDVEAFEKNDLPILFKCTPDTLLNSCLKIVDALPLPKVYAWTIEEVCKWLREIGYRQYQNTFRANQVNGHNLLLLDASALSAMNIKDFDHIKDITRSIRSLFFFEMTKFGRSITLYPEFHEEIYKLFRLKTGAKYDMRRSDLWRKMQLIRQKEPNFSHWEILERWLNFAQGPKYIERFGDAHRYNLYACTARLPKAINVAKSTGICHCLPPCDCKASEFTRRPPWRFKCLPRLTSDTKFVKDCEQCIPPCTCHWSSKRYQTHAVLGYLKEHLPNKYGAIPAHIYQQMDDKFYRYSIVS